MKEFDETSPRRVIPRWRRSTVLTHSAEGVPLPAKQHLRAKRSPDEELTSLRTDWQHEKGLAFAADLVGAAFVHAHPEVALDAAKFLIAQGDLTPHMLRALAAEIVTWDNRPTTRSEDLPSSQDAIRVARQRLRAQLENPILLVDTARHFSVLGANEKAKRLIQMALHFAPNHRLVLRAAARLFVHLGDPLQAHWLLKNSPATPFDPWLLAAEISVASVAARRSKHMKRGDSLVRTGGLSPSQITELASALATAELNEGNNKLAKKLFATALKSPNDNSVAQAEWANRRGGLDLPILEQVKEVPFSFEAQFWVNYNDLDLDDAKKSAALWIHDEPFSKRPAIMGTFVAGMDGDYDTAKQIADIGLRANPNDYQLLNNLVFAEASTGRVLDAWNRLSQNINKNSAHCIANLGLIAYRTGNIEAGRKLYELAISVAQHNKEDRIAAAAAGFHAREALIAGDVGAPKIVARAERLMKSEQNAGMRLVWGQVEKALGQYDSGQKLKFAESIPEVEATIKYLGSTDALGQKK